MRETIVCFAHFVLCYTFFSSSAFFCCDSGLLDSCIILLHFTEFTDLYFIRYGFFCCLHSSAFFTSYWCVFVCVSACLGYCSFFVHVFFGRFLFFIAFHIRIHELFFASFGYKFLFYSQVTSVLRREKANEKKRTETHKNVYPFKTRSKRIIFALKNYCTKN